MTKKKYLSILLVLMLHLMAAGQQTATISRSNIQETIDGKNFYIHMVRDGQSLAAIANAYGVTEAEINRHNPRIQGAVKTGDVIKIPATGTAAPTAAETPRVSSPPSGGFRTHTVQAQETFFGIARQYEISASELQAANPQIQSLQPGHVLKIPASTAQSPEAEQPQTPAPQVVSPQEPRQPTQPEPSAQPVQSASMHTVAPGETLFSLSRRYNISIEELQRLNPELKEGLKAGQVLIIKETPKTGNTQTQLQQPSQIQDFRTVPDTVVEFIYHRVRRGETLYGLATRYKISEDDIVRYNPQVEDVIQVRQVLRIPQFKITTKKIEVELEPDLEEPDLPLFEEEVFDCIPMPQPGKMYRIGLMLPFFLDAREEIVETDTSVAVIPPDPLRRFDFMQFYYGAMLAFDSLRQLGFNASVFVWDVDNSPESLLRAMADPNLATMDMIIGPVFANNFTRMAHFAREHQINIVNPLSPRSEFLNLNPYVIKSQPSAEKQVKLIASYVRETFPGRNIIVVRQFSFSETETLKTVLSELDGFNVNEVIYIRDSLSGIVRFLNPGTENIVIGLSSEKVFVMDLVRKLNDIRAEYPIIGFGLRQWDDFNLETDHMVNLRLHLPASQLINYESEDVVRFMQQFKAKYDVEPIPGRFALTAWDVVFYYGSALHKFGRNFNECLPSYKFRGLQLPFSFEPAGVHGRENKGLILYRIQQHRQIEVYPAR